VLVGLQDKSTCVVKVDMAGTVKELKEQLLKELHVTGNITEWRILAYYNPELTISNRFDGGTSPAFILLFYYLLFKFFCIFFL
jgi:hypothetical protein